MGSPITTETRPRVVGKFLFVGEEKLFVRGVTYGTFRPDAEGNEFHEPTSVERDFAQMVAHGVNAIRTYTVPPPWLLDIAQRYGLRVMIGLPWEQHVTFLDDEARVRSIEERVRAGVRACAGHPAVLAYAIGNEIPSSIVRWYGRHRVERFLERLYRTAKAEDPEGLVTYVNYPSTEYLQLPFVDVVCFNVYLESQDRFESYLARLQNIAGDRPLVVAEVGLDSHRQGEIAQARAVGWQVRTTFAAGGAGVFVFAWTDEWHRGGYDVDDWDFGLTSRDRRPKPALHAARRAFAEVPFPSDLRWPRISVVVCSYNGERTIGDCLDGVSKLEYPNFETIVVDDGSTDATADTARAFGVRVIRTANRGLSHARNVGLKAATGEIVAYLDDDARPDPHWLTYLAATFMTTTHAGVGGPNLAPPDDGMIADCVAHAPGGPTHILVSDCEAEHIPGCNMAFRKRCLQQIGGFDAQFRVAGDDVDVCWRLQQQGWTLGFSPAALVWHHRRNSVRAYWKQQVGYGKAEALLERKWPERYNVLGHLTWGGRIYGKGLALALGWHPERIFQGTWGGAPFQTLHHPEPGVLALLPLMPEWNLVIAALAGLAALGTLWSPLLLVLPLLAIALGASLMQASLSAARVSFASAPRSRRTRLQLRLLTGCLYLLQPLARLWGRLRVGLTPWRWRTVPGLSLPRPQTVAHWSESWQAPARWIQDAEAALEAIGVVVLRGGDYDRWDLEARSGTLGAARVLATVEEHGGGKQLVRFRWWPRCSTHGLVLALLLATLSLGTASSQAGVVAVILGFCAMGISVRMLLECAASVNAVARALSEVSTQRPLIQVERPKGEGRSQRHPIHEDRAPEPRLVHVAGQTEPHGNRELSRSGS